MAVRAMLEVNAIKADDARWMQSLSLTPGWYYMSADIRTENVGKDNSGATISVMEDGIMSPEIKGTTSWTQRRPLHAGRKKGRRCRCRIARRRIRQPQHRQAFFRNASVVADRCAAAQRASRSSTSRRFARHARAGADRKALSLVLTYLFLIRIAYVGMVPVSALEPPKVTRAEARREAKKKVARR